MKSPLPSQDPVEPAAEEVPEEDIVEVEVNVQDGPARRRRWSEEEVETLTEHVEEHGTGNWIHILEAYPDIFVGRTVASIKSKWNSLARALAEENEEEPDENNEEPVENNVQEPVVAAENNEQAEFERRSYIRWSEVEADTLRAGVGIYGTGKWKLIWDAYPLFDENRRTVVDLKDKWRTMTRARAQFPVQAEEEEEEEDDYEEDASEEEEEDASEEEEQEEEEEEEEEEVEAAEKKEEEEEEEEEEA